MAGGANPWVTRSVEPETTPVAADDEVLAPARGPLAPQKGVPTPSLHARLPVSQTDNSAVLWFVGAHGGSGESTLASLVSEWKPAGHQWPGPKGGPARVVLVARSNMHGLKRAQQAATQWASGLLPHVDLVGLVVVADAPGRLPRSLRDFEQVVAGGAPRTWHVPWISSWRLGEVLAVADLPRDVRRMVAELNVVTQSGVAGVGTVM